MTSINEFENLQKKLTPHHLEVLRPLMMKPHPEKVDYSHSRGQTLRDRCPKIHGHVGQLVRELEDLGLVLHLAHRLETVFSGYGAEDLRDCVSPLGVWFAGDLARP